MTTRASAAMSIMRTTSLTITIALVALALSGCASTETLEQRGSSTVLPLAERWAEGWGTENGVLINVAGGGSGSGASGLCAGEIDLADMSRAMKESEKETCRAAGIEPVEWIVAFDGLSVVVPRGNTFVDSLSVAQLAHIFRADDPALFWDEVEPSIAGAPHQPISLCYPDADSGTYEYFNEVILDEQDPRTGDGVQQSPNDNVLVTCLGNDADAIGYFGYAYFVENKDKVKLVAVDGVKPTQETVASGAYDPLSRPLYIYTDGVPRDGNTLHGYLSYIYGAGQEIVPQVGYVALDPETKGGMVAQLR